MPGSWIVKGAFRKEGLQSFYGAGAVVACGAGHQLPIRSANLPKEISREYTDDTDGKGGVKNSYTIRKHTQGSVSLDMTYQGLEHLLSCAMGFSNAPATVAAGMTSTFIPIGCGPETVPLPVTVGLLVISWSGAGHSALIKAYPRSGNINHAWSTK